MQYTERRKVDEDLWIKSQFQTIKRRLDVVEKQKEDLRAILKRQRLDTDRQQKMERVIKVRIRIEEAERKLEKR